MSGPFDIDEVCDVGVPGAGIAIDDRIACRCVSCYPDVTDDSCACAWEFSLETPPV